MDISIIIHPGIGRTGTTLVQRTLEENANFLYFGRSAINRNINIKQLLDKIFCKHEHPYILQEIATNANFKDLDALINNLAIVLFEEWKIFYKDKALDHTKIIISDEYIFHTPERLVIENFMIIFSVVKKLEVHIKGFLKRDKVVFNRLITINIRNQASLIHSIWMNEKFRSSYSWFKKKEYKLYESVLDFNKIIKAISSNKGWNVNVVPFEILEKKGISEYMSAVFPELQIKILRKSFHPNKSNLINGVFSSKFYPLSRFLRIKTHYFFYKRKISRQKISIINIIPQKFFENLLRLVYPIENKLLKEIEVKFDKVFISQIRDSYSSSNKKLSDRLGLNLKDLGY